MINRSRPRTLILAAAVVAAVALVATLVVAAAGADEDPSPQRSMQVGVSEETPPGSPAAPATGSGDEPSLGRGGSEPNQPAGGKAGGELQPNAGPSSSNRGGPDQAVSSDDPPLSPRPAPPPPDDGIDSFEDCAAAGYPIAESYPEQCFTPDGRSFTRQIG